MDRTVTPATREALAASLPPAVAAALADPAPADVSTVEAGGIPWFTRRWGRPDDPPVLLIHGVTSSSRAWWRVGPALAAAGFRVVAVDQAGHGRTGHWTGHRRFDDNAGDIVGFARAAGLDRPDLAVIGHSWGAMTAAELLTAGLRLRVIVLLDPPAVPRRVLVAMTVDPTDRHYDDVATARDALARANPGWHALDVDAKAESLTQFDVEAVRSVLSDNGDWDGGLAALRRAGPNASAWLIRGDPAAGGLVPDAAIAGFEAVLGRGRIVTIAGASHSPQRTHPEATVGALVRAITTA